MNLSDMIIPLFTGISLVVLFVIVLKNFFGAPVIGKRQGSADGYPLVSVLIPARDEENNIGRCLRHVVKQNYRNLEIIVLDDYSMDDTAWIVKGYAKKDRRVKLLSGKALPEGWLGKNHACGQLAENAAGDYILFLDADVTLAENAIGSALYEITHKKAEMLSVFPSQKFGTLGEYLVVPLMNWFLLTFLSLRAVYKSGNPAFSAANGQFIMFRRNYYSDFGGHRVVKDKVVEDMELARLVKKRGDKVITLLGGDAVNCKMYNGFVSSIRGFSKNFFPGFNAPSYLFILFIFFSLFIFLSPVILIFQNFIYLAHIILIAVTRVMISIISRQNILLNLLLHPLQMLILAVTGFYSVYVTLLKKTIWKGRKIS